MTEALAALVTKLLALPVAAKGAVGVTAAAAVIGTAGAAGVLPAAADESKSPAAEQPEQAVVSQDVVSQDVDAEEGEGGRPADAPALPEQAAFGQQTAADARDDGVVGADVAEQARANPLARPPAAASRPEQKASRVEQPPAAPEPPAMPPQSDAGRQTAEQSSGRQVPAGPPAGRDAAESGASNSDRTETGRP
jgi:hypothetical protein